MTKETGYKGDLVSYLTLRRVVGVLGVSLPVVLAFWGLLSVPVHGFSRRSATITA
jgi:hypothetical protein